MTSVLSTFTYVAESIYGFGFELGDVLKPAIPAESNARLATVDRTMTISEVSA